LVGSVCHYPAQPSGKKISLIGNSGKEDHCSELIKEKQKPIETDSGWMECPDDHWCDTMYFSWYLPFLDTREVEEFQI
jgi:hypothetical protein